MYCDPRLECKHEDGNYELCRFNSEVRNPYIELCKVTEVVSDGTAYSIARPLVRKLTSP
jgi:hypothetical protein